MKICTKCKQLKDLDCFTKKRNGKNSRCKECVKLYRIIYLELNKDKIRKQVKKYALSHSEELKKYNQQYYRTNQKRLYKRHKAYSKIYNKTPQAKAKTNARIRKKLKTNISFRIAKNLRLRIWHSLKGKVKSKKTIDLIGCSVEKLKTHLSSQFSPNMSFENYGEWHIDHIKPCVSFDLSKPKEQEKCFNYTNLQPLWATSEIAKRHGDFGAIGNLEKGFSL